MRSIQGKQTMILPWIKHFSKVNAISGWFTIKNALQVSKVVRDRLAAILKGKCCGKHIASHVIFH